MIKPIITYDINSSDNPKILQEKAKKVTDYSSCEVKNCIQDLRDTLESLIDKYGKTRGIGLSAPQIGYSLFRSCTRALR